MRLAPRAAAHPFPSLPPRPPQPTCGGGSKTTATPSARGEGREVLALGRCHRAGFAGGGWERERGGAEPGGGSPGPAAAGLPVPRPVAPRWGGGEAGLRPGEAGLAAMRAGGRSAAGWGRGIGPPPPRLGGSPAPAAGTAGCLGPVPGWVLRLRSARRAGCAPSGERLRAGEKATDGESRCQLPSARTPFGRGGGPGAARPPRPRAAPACPAPRLAPARAGASLPVLPLSGLRSPLEGQERGSSPACAVAGLRRAGPAAPCGSRRSRGCGARRGGGGLGLFPGCACCLRQGFQRVALHMPPGKRELLISIPRNRPRDLTQRSAFKNKINPGLLSQLHWLGRCAATHSLYYTYSCYSVPKK